VRKDEFGLGIDTGGTFTDAALVDITRTHVAAAAKAPTTRHDLAEGIIEAVGALPHGLLRRVGLVSLSTTLATNAIVEGNGHPACLVLIGYDRSLIDNFGLRGLLPTTEVVFVRGGHTASGAEREPLDEEALRHVAADYAGSASAFAVSGFFGVRNPGHELRAREILEEATGLPVTCGHELSSELDSILRAATCALNASLIPLLRELMLSVQRALVALGITAPLMVVRGDGSLMRVETALEKPIETILSGPAASAVGARALSGLRDLIAVDIGGTTTDIAVLKAGLPKLNASGATVGGWRTLVRAVETTSVGLGGDSQVRLNGGRRLEIGPRRVVPLCFLAMRYPEIKEMLAEVRAAAPLVEPEEAELFVLQRVPQRTHWTAVEERILARLEDGPQSMWRLSAEDPWAAMYLRDGNRLEQLGLVARSAFTPTDALHVVGSFCDWDRQASQIGADLLAGRLAMEAVPFAEAVIAEVQHQVVRTTVRAVSNGRADSMETACDALLMNLALGMAETGSEDLEVELRLKLPVVGIGAPARHFIMPAACMMNAPAKLPSKHAVANAVGAICGSVVSRVTIGVQALYKPSGIAGYSVAGPFGRETHARKECAMRSALAHAERLARMKAEEDGAQDVEIRVRVSDQTGTAQGAADDTVYLGSVVEATAIGRPTFAAESEGYTVPQRKDG